MHFKKWKNLWEWCISAEGDYLESDGGQFVFDQVAAPSPEIMDICGINFVHVAIILDNFKCWSANILNIFKEIYS
jgi:hypothetical protein